MFFLCPLVTFNPVIYRFGDDKDVKKLFDDLWEETTNSERATLQLYLAEIVSLLCEGIASSSWAVKKKVRRKRIVVDICVV